MTTRNMNKYGREMQTRNDYQRNAKWATEDELREALTYWRRRVAAGSCFNYGAEHVEDIIAELRSRGLDS